MYRTREAVPIIEIVCADGILYAQVDYLKEHNFTRYLEAINYEPGSSIVIDFPQFTMSQIKFVVDSVVDHVRDERVTASNSEQIEILDFLMVSSNIKVDPKDILKRPEILQYVFRCPSILYNCAYQDLNVLICKDLFGILKNVENVMNIQITNRMPMMNRGSMLLIMAWITADRSYLSNHKDLIRCFLDNSIKWYYTKNTIELLNEYLCVYEYVYDKDSMIR